MSVCRLVRKWLSAHLLTNQIESLTSDLIVHLALNGSDCGSQVNGFYRTLHFIASKYPKLFFSSSAMLENNIKIKIMILLMNHFLFHRQNLKNQNNLNCEIISQKIVWNYSKSTESSFRRVLIRKRVC